MTVIAGASLFNGVILLADTRVTIQRRGRPDIRCDIAQKLFFLTPTTAIGFSGDVRAASAIICEVFRQLPKRAHTDALSLRQWLPRLVAATYRAHARKHGASALAFIVGSVVPGRNNLIERAKVAELFKTIGYGQSPIQRNFVPDVVMRILMQPATETFVAVSAPAGLLYTMTAPDFVPRHYAPLEYCAIGSGHGSIKEIAKTADWLLAGQPGNDMVESMALTEAVSEFVAAEGIDSCGGMFPCLKIDHRGGAFLCGSRGIPPNRISLLFDATSRRLVQQNEGTGKEVPLQRPWEIDASALRKDLRFDDWHDAVRAFNPLRLKRKDP
ncbi:hypothetical protein [Bradyrhizobium sp. SZCCHNS2002]|uniref:hypothetical protein n=1 Tax=Bradyrhizobium sp. SZCCHNS2002 TaxID=3057302 RepID=UPI0029162840|nr:hypothetical protein [Bradyrhizobium sp. SZCCHNS2002]